MPSKIRVLDEHTINKIAAGEVIENPASVIKELVENSIDAGATNISIEIKGGGRQLIRVTDNGIGMNQDDALLCLERHATSKIRNVEDIDSLYTMGFRGEAIPSIAAISKFTLLTKQAEASPDSLGTMIIVDGGQLYKCSPAACSYGTTVEVKALFFNVPARRKFQKSPTYDSHEILKMLTLLSLGHPQIKFELISNQKAVLSANFPKQGTFLEQLGDRIASVQGAEYFESLCPLEISKGDYSLKGYIGQPAYTRQNRTGQFIFINLRGVSSPLISYTVREGYGTTLSTNRHPIYVLHLTVPGNLVDVNVHPQKKEVRLRHEQLLKHLIVQGIEDALRKSGETFFNTETSPFFERPAIERPPEVSFFPEKIDYFDLKFAEQTQPYEPLNENPALKNKKPQQTQQEISLQTLFKLPEEQKKIALRAITTMPGYILCESSHYFTSEQSSESIGLCFIDQHAAHSRVIYERLQRNSKGEKLEVQAFLIPHRIRTTPLESECLKENIHKLNEMGILIREEGQNSFVVNALPQVFCGADIEGLVEEFIRQLSKCQSGAAIAQEKEKQVAKAASRAALAKKKCLTVEEGQFLSEQLMLCDHPWRCPHGEATIVHLYQEDLAALFRKN